MSQPVKLSNELVLEARLTAQLTDRSIAGQIEFWAQLGRAIDPLLDGSRVLALKQSGAECSLSEILASVDSPAGRKRVAEYLDSRPFPHYRPVAHHPGLVMRIAEDGLETVGRFVDRQFQAVEP